MLHRCQLRRGSRIVVPDIVMHGLEMPQIFAGARIESEQAVGEQIVARAIAAIQFIFGGRDRKIRDAALLVDGDLTPHIHAAHVLVGVLWPRVVPEFALTRNRVEHPCQLARAHVKRAQIARRRQITFAGKASENDQIFENPAGSSGGQRNRRAVDPDLQIQLAVIREGIHGLSRQRVDGVQVPARGDEDAAVFAVFALPVVRAALPGDSAPAAAAGAERMHPQLFAGRRVESNQRPALRRDVRDVIDHQRAEHRSPVWRRVGPCHFDLVHIRSVDLLQRRIVRAVGTAEVLLPARGGFLREYGPSRKTTEHQRCKNLCFHDSSFSRSGIAKPDTLFFQIGLGDGSGLERRHRHARRRHRVPP